MTVHQFFCILHFCHTCSLCRVELVVQFPARGSTQVLLCLFPGVLWLWHFLYSVGPHPVPSLHILPLLCRGHSRRVRLAKQETLTPPGHLVSPLVCRGPWMSTVVLYCWCHSDSASVLLYFTIFMDVMRRNIYDEILSLTQKNETNNPISSNGHPLATANKAIHSLKIGGCYKKQR